jgi:hypothetical protein
MSKKIIAAQHNYPVFKMETIATLEVPLKWEEKLISNCINVVTNHKANSSRPKDYPAIKCSGGNI